MRPPAPRQHLHSLNVLITATDKTLGVEDGVARVHGSLVFGGITNQSFGIGECHIRWRGTISLIIGNDFHFTMLEHTNTGISGSKIDTDGWSFAGHFQLVSFQSHKFTKTENKFEVQDKLFFL